MSRATAAPRRRQQIKAGNQLDREGEEELPFETTDGGEENGDGEVDHVVENVAEAEGGEEHDLQEIVAVPATISAVALR